MPMQTVTPCLWFHHEAEEAARFYTSVVPNSKITELTYYGNDGPMPAGTVLTVAFELDGQPFVGLNGGASFPFTEAVSFQIACGDQEEIDRYWEILTEGGEPGQCGWLKDRYGLSWQIVPARLIELIAQGDGARRERVMAAMYPMRKLDIATLEAAGAPVG